MNGFAPSEQLIERPPGHVPLVEREHRIAALVGPSHRAEATGAPAARRRATVSRRRATTWCQVARITRSPCASRKAWRSASSSRASGSSCQARPSASRISRCSGQRKSGTILRPPISSGLLTSGWAKPASSSSSKRHVLEHGSGRRRPGRDQKRQSPAPAPRPEPIEDLEQLSHVDPPLALRRPHRATRDLGAGDGRQVEQGPRRRRDRDALGAALGRAGRAPPSGVR